MPLAANTKRLDTIESKIDSGYAYDVAFVGSLYIEQLNFFDQMYDALPEYSKGYLHALMAIQMQIQNYDLIESSLSPIIKDLYRSYPFGIEPGNRATREYL